MYAVEFQAKIKDGTIEIPEVYRHRFKERVRVILLAIGGIRACLWRPVRGPSIGSHHAPCVSPSRDCDNVYAWGSRAP